MSTQLVFKAILNVNPFVENSYAYALPMDMQRMGNLKILYTLNLLQKMGNYKNNLPLQKVRQKNNPDKNIVPVRF